MSEFSVVQLIGSLGRNRGGLTKAIYDRSQVLHDAERIVFINLSQQRDGNEIFEDLKAEAKIPDRAEIVNFYSEVGARGPSGPARRSMLSDLAAKGAKSSEEKAGASVIRRFFVDGAFVGLRVLDGDGMVLREEYHDATGPWKVTHRDHFDRRGRVWKREYLDEHFISRYQILYNQTGGAYFASWIYPNGNAYRINVFEGDVVTQYPNISSAIASWVGEYVASLGRCVVISDEPQTVACLYLPKFDRSKVKTLAAIHTTHYKNHIDPSDGFKSWYPQYLDNRNLIDRYVFFSNAQLGDFLADARTDNISTAVIPHPAPAVMSSETLPRRNLLVTVSRLDKVKRISDAVIAFSRVAHLFPELHYDIYGIGPEESALRRLIVKLHLEERISLKGYTNEPLAIFRSAALSLVTTLYEGFGLTLVESMSSGCPVVAYDVKYGPTEIVQNNQSGILVPSGDIEGLAAALERVLSDRVLLARLSAGAKARATDFSAQEWESGWKRAIFNWQ